MIKTEVVSASLTILNQPCPFEKLTLKPSPLKNVTIFFNEASVTQTFTMDDLVSWKKNLDCGPLKVEFFTKGSQPLPEDFFA